jgi:phosphoglucosamine mutase
LGRRLFGTDGIRGVANVEPVTPETALRLGRALVQLGRSGVARRQEYVIGKDTRRSGDMLECALAAGICSAGGDARLAGILPTPAIGFLTRNLEAAAGVVVSASHNPFADNGIKFFAHTGFKVLDAVEEEIERLVLGAATDRVGPTAGAVGRIVPIADAAERYMRFVKSTLPPHLRLDGVKMVVDCAHGAAHRVGPAILRDLGAQVVAIGTDPDGENINRGCGALHPERLQATVVSERAQIGIALDGDADRAIRADEHGELVDGDEVLAMTAADMLARGTLRQATVVATVMSNMGLEVALRERGIRLVRVQVGDRNVVEEMRRHGYNLGGEQSGHLLFLDHSTTGDGLIAGLNVARLMIECQRPLSELKRAMVKFPQVLRNVPVKNREDLQAIPAVRQTIERVVAELDDRGRVLVRYSGTEPLVRVMVEGEQAARVEACADEIAAAIRTHVRGAKTT